MATQYTDILKLALPTQGELSGSWGDVVNDNITSMLEEAVAGMATISTWTTNSHTLTEANGLTSESRAAMLLLNDGAGLTAAGEVICPAKTKLYMVNNQTSYIITVKTAAGTGIAIPPANVMWVHCDGTNVGEASTYAVNMVVSNFTATLADIDGGTIDGVTIGATTAGAGTFTTASATDVITTDIQVTNIQANDGTTAGSIADTTGVVTIGSSVLTTTDIDGGTIDGVTIGGTTAAAGTFTTVTTSGEIQANAGIALPDSQKATFGASDDLQIYHDGSHSRINDAGTGSLILSANEFYVYDAGGTEPKIGAITNGAVDLYYDSSKKLATTAAGVDVTGSVLASGSFELDSGGTGVFIGGGSTGTTAIGKLYNSAGALTLDTDSTRSINLATGATNRMRVDGSTGDISFYEDTGTTAKFFWDASAEALGIGNTAPSDALSVTGKVRIGVGTGSGNTNDMILKAAVSPAIDVGGSTQAAIVTTNGTGIGSVHVGIEVPSNDANDGFYIATDSDNDGVVDTLAMKVKANGNVGIGTSSPIYKFEVSDGTRTAVINPNSVLDGIFLGTKEAKPLVLGTGDLERARIDSSGNVGIGTSSPQRLLHIANTGGNAYAAIQSSDTGVSELFLGDVSNYLASSIRYDNSSNEFSFRVASSEELKLDNLSLRVSTGICLGNGLTHNAANTLDDYEEGTFSGTVEGSVYSGTYTKVGRICHISIVIDNSGSTGTQLATLPFSSKNSGTGFNGTQPTFNTTFSTTDVYIAPFSGGPALYAYNKAGAAESVSATGSVTANFVYETD